MVDISEPSDKHPLASRHPERRAHGAVPGRSVGAARGRTTDPVRIRNGSLKPAGADLDQPKPVTEAQRRSVTRGGTRMPGSEPNDNEPPPKTKQPTGQPLVRNAPVVIGVVVMAVYFVWVCLQMAPRTNRGDLLLAVIFGSAAVGTIGGVAGLWRRRR
jgi:hypothetical protein